MSSDSATKKTALPVASGEMRPSSVPERSTTSTRTPLRLETAVPTEKMDLIWDRWYSTPQSSGTSVSSFPSHNDFSLRSVRSTTASSVFELDSPAPSTSPATQSGGRWALFRPRKSKTGTPTITLTPVHNGAPKRDIVKKKSKTLEKLTRHKSTSDLLELRPEDVGKVNAFFAPVPHIRPPLPSTPCSNVSTPTPPFSDIAFPPNSTIYFTVDPDWDPSQGDASMYLISAPVLSTSNTSNSDAAHVPRTPPAKSLGIRPSPLKGILRRRARSHISDSRSLRGVDDNASFLIFD